MGYDSDCPKIILQVVRDLTQGRIFHYKNRFRDKRKNLFKAVFLKIHFHNKGIELVKLNQLMKKVNAFIPPSFSSHDNPVIVYTRSPTIANKVFNYREVINSIKIEDINNDIKCNCHSSEFCDPHHKHIITGNLNIIKNRDLRQLLMKGPKYREPRMINWIKTFEYINGIAECQIKWANKENVIPEALNGWATSLISLVSKRISKLKKLKRFRYLLKSLF